MSINFLEVLDKTVVCEDVFFTTIGADDKKKCERFLFSVGCGSWTSVGCFRGVQSNLQIKFVL